MKSLWVLGAAVAFLVAMAADAEASCCNRGGGCGGCVPSGCGGCGVYVADCAPGGVTYEQRTVTTYQAVWKEREVMVTVCKPVTVEQKFEYTEMVTTVTPTKQQVKVCKQVMVEEPFKYTVVTPVMTQEKRKVKVCKQVIVEEPFKYTVMQPEYAMQKVKVTRYTCVPETVVRDVAVCTTVMVPTCYPPSCCNPCGSMGYTCQRVMTMQQVTCTVMKQVATVEEVDVKVCTWKQVEQAGVRKVCKIVEVEQEVLVNVCNYQQEVKEGKRMVCKLVEEMTEVTVNLVKCEPVKKMGTRMVCTMVTSQEKRMVKYCEMVPVQTVVNVPVSTGCYVNSCYRGGSGCFSGCNLGGCFRGCGIGGGCFSGCGLGGCR